MDDKIFRKKSIDRISSPDQLDMYIKASGPRMWVLLTAIVLFLVGAIVWAAVGSIEVKLSVGAWVSGDSAYVFVSEQDYDRLTDGMFLRSEERESTACWERLGPFDASSELPLSPEVGAYCRHASGLDEDSWYYILVFGAGSMQPGMYKTTLVLEQISHITYIIN